MTAIIILASMAILGWSAWTVLTGYAAATGTPAERLLAACRHMATLVYSYALAAAGALVALLIELSGILGMPEFRDLLQQYLSPQLAAILIALVPIVTVYLRTRTFGFERREGE